MQSNRIRVITPVITEELNDAESAERLGDRGREVSRVQIVRGPASIESEFETALAVPDTLRLVVEAEQQGYDAAVIDCMGDPGLRPARELSSMLVLGPAETGMHVACLLGHRFSIVTISEAAVPEFENMAAVHGLSGRLTSVRSIETPVLDLAGNDESVVAALVEESTRAVVEDHAHVILLGCTGFEGLAARVADGLEAAGISGVPVIDPMPTAVRVAQALVDAGLVHSKRTFAYPPRKTINGFDFLPDVVRGGMS